MLKSIEYVNGLVYLNELPEVIKNVCNTQETPDNFIYTNAKDVYRVDYIKGEYKCHVIAEPLIGNVLRLDLDNGESIVTKFYATYYNFPEIIVNNRHYLVTGKKADNIYTATLLNGEDTDVKLPNLVLHKLSSIALNDSSEPCIVYADNVSPSFVEDDIKYHTVDTLTKLLNSDTINDLNNFKVYIDETVYYVKRDDSLKYLVYKATEIESSNAFMVNYKNLYSVVANSAYDRVKNNIIIDNEIYPIIGVKNGMLILDKRLYVMYSAYESVRERKNIIDTYRLKEPNKLLELNDIEYAAVLDFAKNIGLKNRFNQLLTLS